MHKRHQFRVKKLQNQPDWKQSQNKTKQKPWPKKTEKSSPYKQFCFYFRHEKWIRSIEWVSKWSRWLSQLMSSFLRILGSSLCVNILSSFWSVSFTMVLTRNIPRKEPMSVRDLQGPGQVLFQPWFITTLPSVFFPLFQSGLTSLYLLQMDGHTANGLVSSSTSFLPITANA